MSSDPDAEPGTHRSGSSTSPRKALWGGISKVNSSQGCHLLAILPLKMTPKSSPNLETVPWDTPPKSLLWIATDLWTRQNPAEALREPEPDTPHSESRVGPLTARKEPHSPNPAQYDPKP